MSEGNIIGGKNDSPCSWEIIQLKSLNKPNNKQDANIYAAWEEKRGIKKGNRPKIINKTKWCIK